MAATQKRIFASEFCSTGGLHMFLHVKVQSFPNTQDAKHIKIHQHISLEMRVNALGPLCSHKLLYIVYVVKRHFRTECSTEANKT